MVEYALRDSGKPIGVASYRTVSALAEMLRDQLAPEQVALLMDDIS